ncbi:MAG: 23S rRNA (adenine1618-N6)-methyltransferase [Paraglaciecola sp.]
MRYTKNKENLSEKIKLHPRNAHRNAYDFKQLCAVNSDLTPFVHVNKYGTETIDFFNPTAVKALNQALLQHHYDIDYWAIPDNYLCPPVPGRADYLHYIADLLKESNGGKMPKGTKVKCLDIGMGASCIYPIIGVKSYDWSFVATDVNPVAIETARDTVKKNRSLRDKVKIRQQRRSDNIFTGVFKEGEKYDLSICNPPFHASKAEAAKGTARKLKNLAKGKKIEMPALNFGGQKTELFYKGGERRFVEIMIQESTNFAMSCLWFSTLISKESNLKPVEKMLEKAKAVKMKVIPMEQGNKKSRIVAWTFLSEKQQKIWAQTRFS